MRELDAAAGSGLRQIDPQPATDNVTPEEIEAQIAVLQVQKAEGLRRAGVAVWPLHSRRCRRQLSFKHKVKPEQIEAHMALCTCGWPAARFEMQRRQEAALEAGKHQDGAA